MSDNSAGNMMIGFILAILIAALVIGGFYVLRNSSAVPQTQNRISGSITLPTSVSLPTSIPAPNNSTNQ